MTAARTTDRDLYVRGSATLLASWEEYARGSTGTALVRLPRLSGAVFPTHPKRAVHNKALLDGDLGAAERAVAVDAMQATYRSAGVERCAARVHEATRAFRRS